MNDERGEAGGNHPKPLDQRWSTDMVRQQAYAALRGIHLPGLLT
ncbi:MAG: hypothetical protein WD651_12830 [Acidimicrobiia bacterium]